MASTMAPPWPVSGYGALPTPAAFSDTTDIWYTSETFGDPEDAVEAAAVASQGFLASGFNVTGVGFEVVSIDPATETGVFKGYVTFAGDAPSGSIDFGGTEKVPWWHYGLAAGGGVVGGIVIGALIGATLAK